MNKSPLLIVGYGRFGRLAASLLTRHFEVHILDVRRGIRPERGIRRALNADIPHFRIVLLALPVHRLEGFLKANGRRFAPGTFVADLAAVKEMPLRWLKSNLPPSVFFTGLHPLFGPDSAGKSHEGHLVVVCRGRTTDECHRRILTALNKIGLKSIETDAATHDKTIASTLFMTQWIGRVAVDCGLGKPSLFENPSFSSLKTLMSRALNDRAEILRDIYMYNRYSRNIVKIFRARMGAGLKRA